MKYLWAVSFIHLVVGITICNTILYEFNLFEFFFCQESEQGTIRNRNLSRYYYNFR